MEVGTVPTGIDFSLVPHSLANTMSLISKHFTIAVTLIISPQKRKFVNIMLDSGATGNFLDLTLAQMLDTPAVSKKVSEPVCSVDG